MKQIEKYLKEYEQTSDAYFKTHGMYNPPRSIEEFEILNLFFYDTILSKDVYTSDSLKKTEVYPKLLDGYNTYGIYGALKTKDFNYLNNVLHQTSIHDLYLHCILRGGLTNASALLPIATAFACNNFEIITKVFPKDSPPTDCHFYVDHAVNLIKLMYYAEKENDIVHEAQTFLNKINSLWHKNVIIYFLALYKRNLNEVNQSLEILCKTYPKLWVKQRKINKFFAKEIHGFYRFAKVIDPIFFEQITRPTHPCFFHEFEKWQEKENYPVGKISYIYPSPLEYMNNFYKISFPRIPLKTTEINRKKFHTIDHDKFILDTKNAIESL